MPLHDSVQLFHHTSFAQALCIFSSQGSCHFVYSSNALKNEFFYKIAWNLWYAIQVAERKKLVIIHLKQGLNTLSHHVTFTSARCH